MSESRQKHAPAKWNLLVLSDLHLGDQLPGESRERVQWNADVLSHHLCGFLDHHAANRKNGLPWRLLIAGDMIDFMRIHIPLEENQASPGSDRTEWYLPPNTVEGALQKLDQVLAIHHNTFAAFSRFLLAGNEVVMITGNHDAELNWIEVQESLREQLYRLSLNEGTCERAAFYQRVRFMPWFYYEPDRIYVEHGHLYDRYCNIENFLTLQDTDEHPETELLSFSHFATHYQYRSEQAFSGLPLEHLDQWTGMQMLRWLLTRPTRQKIQLATQIIGMIVCLLRTAWNARYRHATALPPQKRQVVFRQIAKEQGLPVEAIEPLQQFIQPPIHAGVFDTIQSLYLDRMALVAGTVFGFLVLLVAPWPVYLRAALMTIAAAGFVAIFGVLSKSHPPAESAQQLLSAAYRIASYLHTPLIVFGHSHELERQWLCSDQLYVNIGTWIPPGDHHEAGTQEPQPTEMGLPHTPPFAIPSVPVHQTPFLMLTYDGKEQQTVMGYWDNQSAPTFQPLPTQHADSTPPLSPTPQMVA